MKALIVAALVALFAVPASAAVIHEPETRSLEISGQTDSLQLLLVRGVLAKGETDTIYMWGNGGSYYAGLEIGRMIRESGARVIIPSGQRCISACAFAAMASKDVLVDGELLIHRPYVTQVPSMLTIDDLAGKYGEVYLHGVKYLLEMGYSFDFAALVIAKTSPCVLFIVDKSETLRALKSVKLPTLQTVDSCKDQPESYG